MSIVPKKKVNVYVDGFNLYHAIVAQNDHRLKWINLRSLAQSYVKPGEELNRVVFFTAILTWQKDKQMRHKNYIRALGAYGVEIVESNFRKAKKHCHVMDRYCDRYEEKQTDVAIASMVLADAMRGTCGRVILVTADSDQVPLVRTLKELFPEITVTLAAPPERGGEARALGEVVDERRPITVERLRGCLLPRTIVNEKGKVVALRPSLYDTKNGKGE